MKAQYYLAQEYCDSDELSKEYYGAFKRNILLKEIFSFLLILLYPFTRVKYNKKISQLLFYSYCLVIFCPALILLFRAILLKHYQDVNEPVVVLAAR